MQPSRLICKTQKETCCGSRGVQTKWVRLLPWTAYNSEFRSGCFGKGDIIVCRALKRWNVLWQRLWASKWRRRGRQSAFHVYEWWKTLKSSRSKGCRLAAPKWIPWWRSEGSIFERWCLRKWSQTGCSWRLLVHRSSLCACYQRWALTWTSWCHTSRDEEFDWQRGRSDAFHGRVPSDLPQIQTQVHLHPPLFQRF